MAAGRTIPLRRGTGCVSVFRLASVLAQMATTSPNGGNLRTCVKLLVHGATTNYSQAVATANLSDPTQRLIYVNSNPPPGGGAIELVGLRAAGSCTATSGRRPAVAIA